MVEARELLDLEPRFAAPGRELGGANQLRVFVRAARQQAEDVLGTHDGEREALQVAVDRREERRSARAQRRGACSHDRGGFGYVLEHLEAGHRVELARRLESDLLDSDAAIVHAQAASRGVLPRRLDVLGREVDGDDACSARREPLGDQTAAATDVENARARERNALGDVVEAQPVDVVQRAKRAARIPPFGGAGTRIASSLESTFAIVCPYARSCRAQRSAAAQTSATSSRNSARSATSCSPAIQTSVTSCREAA